MVRAELRIGPVLTFHLHAGSSGFLIGVRVVCVALHIEGKGARR